MKQILYIHIGLIFIFSFSCQSSNTSDKNNQLTVFAGSSLSHVLSELADSFELKHDVKVRLNLGSSGNLARQIAHGARADIYLSANMGWVDYLDSLRLIKDTFKTTMAYNRLSLVVNKNELHKQLDSATIHENLNNKRIAIGDPLHVPAGKYAEQALKYFKYKCDSEYPLLKAKDVRSALLLVELGEAQMGIIYQTDILQSNKVRRVFTFPFQSHEPIEYGMAVCSKQKVALSFYHFVLNSPIAKAIWLKHGFIL